MVEPRDQSSSSLVGTLGRVFVLLALSLTIKGIQKGLNDVETDSRELTRLLVVPERETTTPNRVLQDTQGVSSMFDELKEEKSISSASLNPPVALPDPIRLLRIPKAGSSSFSAFLRLEYNCTSSLFPPGDCTKRNAALCRRQIHACSGHWVLPPDFMDRSNYPPVVAMFREPVARYISAYHYKGHHGLGTGNNITQHAILFPEFDNVMTTFLAGHKVSWSRDSIRARSVPPITTVSPTEFEERLQLATKVVKHLSFVGLLEYYEDSLRLYCRKYACRHLDQALKAPIERPAYNIERPNYLEDPGHYTSLKKSHTYDLRLFRVVEDQFCRQFRTFATDNSFTASLSVQLRTKCGLAGKMR